jgi:hypothetical protein
MAIFWTARTRSAVSEPRGRSRCPPKQDEVDAEPLPPFFPARHYGSLLAVRATVTRVRGFVGEFPHGQPRSPRPKPPPSPLVAGIRGLGGELETRQRAQLSPPLNAAELASTVQGFFSPDGAPAAHARGVPLRDRLELPTL